MTPRDITLLTIALELLQRRYQDGGLGASLGTRALAASQPGFFVVESADDLAASLERVHVAGLKPGPDIEDRIEAAYAFWRRAAADKESKRQATRRAMAAARRQAKANNHANNQRQPPHLANPDLANPGSPRLSCSGDPNAKQQPILSPAAASPDQPG